jgi:hypothetical protein
MAGTAKDRISDGHRALDVALVVTDNAAAVRQLRRYKGSSRFGIS